jgi:hypothetical protein
VGIRNGAEAVIHGLNSLINSPNIINNPNSVVGLIDFENAFNSISRDAFMTQIILFFPQIATWINYTYGCEAFMFTGNEIIKSKTGVQQGDPLGPLLFSLAIHPLLLKLKNISTGIVSYLDDLVFVADSPQIAKQLLDIVRFECVSLKLQVSPNKSKLWLPSYQVLDNSPSTQLTLQEISSLTNIPLSSLSTEAGILLLGGAVSRSKQFIEQTACDRVMKGLSPLSHITALNDPQLGLLLLRYCLGMVKLNYIWRTTPPDCLSEPMRLATSAILNALRYIVTNHGPGFSSFQLNLASLPIRLGGLGIFIPVDVSKVSFLASLAGSYILQSQIFPSLATDQLRSDIQLRFTDYQSLLQPQLQQKFDFNMMLALSKPQQSLAALYYENKASVLFNNRALLLKRFGQHNFYQCYHLLRALALRNKKHKDHDESLMGPSLLCNPKPSFPFSLSSQWLLIFPNGGLRQRMDPEDYRLALKMRLFIPIFHVPSNTTMICPNCTLSKLDKYGYHLFSCSGSNNLRIDRHETVLKALHSLALAAGFNPKMNASVRCLGEVVRNGVQLLKPADLLIEGDEFPKTCVDVTIVSPLSSAKINTSDGIKIGSLVLRAAKEKQAKYLNRCEESQMGFLPFALDVCGISDPTVPYLLHRFASKIAIRQGWKFGHALCNCLRKISFALQAGIVKQLASAIYSLSSPNNNSEQPMNSEDPNSIEQVDYLMEIEELITDDQPDVDAVDLSLFSDEEIDFTCVASSSSE